MELTGTGFFAGFEIMSRIFVAFDNWIQQLWEAAGGYLPVLLIICGLVLLLWLVRTAGLNVRSSDRVKYYKGNDNK